MNKSRSFKPLIRQGWLRALLFFVSFILISAGCLFIFFLVSHKGKINDGDLQSLSNGYAFWPLSGMICILSVLLIFIFRRWVDRKSIIFLGLDFNGHSAEATAGGMLAIFIICFSSFLLKVTGHLKWVDIILDAKALFLAFGTVLIISFCEELIFRGYILDNLLASFPGWMAVVITSLLFVVFHWTGQTSIGFFTLTNSFIMSLILGLNYMYSRNLWFSFCFHIGWKFLMGPVFGFSGDSSFQTLLQPELNGDINITGGPKGLEGSVVLTAVSLLSLVALYLFLQRKFNPGFRPVLNRK